MVNMEKMNEWQRNLLALAGALALGYTLGSSRTVKAATGDAAFQLVDVKETSSLLVYQPSSNPSMCIEAQPRAAPHCSAAFSM